METKVCSKCKKELPIDDFGKNAKYKDGLQKQCKNCVNAYQNSRNAGIKAPQGVEGDSSLLDKKVVVELVKDVTRSYQGNLETCEPTSTITIGYPQVPTKYQLQKDVKEFAGCLEMQHRRHSNFNVENIDIKEVNGELLYAYEYSMTVQHNKSTKE